MNMPEFNPQEQRLIDQLRQGPAPQLSLVQASSLRERILAEVDVVWESPQAPGSDNALPGKLWPWVIGILAIVAVISLLLSGLSRMTSDEAAQGETLPAPTAQMLETSVIPPTSTVVPTTAPAGVPSATVTTQASVTEEFTPAATLTFTPTATSPAPTATLTATQTPVTTPVSQEEPVIVIEGQISEVGPSYIVIFDMRIELVESAGPGFQLRPGITVRVEGMPLLAPDRIIIQAISITIIQPAQSPGATGQQVQPGAPPPPSRPNSNRSSRSS